MRVGAVEEEEVMVSVKGLSFGEVSLGLDESTNDSAEG